MDEEMTRVKRKRGSGGGGDKRYHKRFKLKITTLKIILLIKTLNATILHSKAQYFFFINIRIEIKNNMADELLYINRNFFPP